MLTINKDIDIDLSALVGEITFVTNYLIVYKNSLDKVVITASNSQEIWAKFRFVDRIQEVCHKLSENEFIKNASSSPNKYLERSKTNPALGDLLVRIKSIAWDIKGNVKVKIDKYKECVFAANVALARRLRHSEILHSLKQVLSLADILIGLEEYSYWESVCKFESMQISFEVA